jgi:CRP-like cAMP-binding protein
MASRREPNRNRLLAALPRADQVRLAEQMEVVSVAFGDVLYDVGDRLNHAYFPESMVVSLGLVVDAKVPMEIAMVGLEGVVGTSFAMGMEVASIRASVRFPGNALRMSSANFRHEFDECIPFRREVLKFGHSLMLQISQTAGCNRFHVVESRLARWLLMTRDRIGEDSFELTQDFLGQMLGVRRVGVTNAAQSLKQRKLISYTRGKLTITNGPALEAAACSCYKKMLSAGSRLSLVR